MKVLIIGSGGREHALADAFARSSKLESLVVSPGNAGIAQSYQCIKLNSFSEIENYCLKTAIDCVFIGGEQPVADGMTDYLRAAGIKVIGPSQAAGRIETSKAFAKALMHKHSIPTASFERAASYEEACRAVESFSYPLVIKADGLAAGKGVYIVDSPKEADEALLCLFKSPNEEGVIIEEYLLGWEVSLFSICDGKNHINTIFSQDHKQLYDNDCGPNTGGMGVLAPIPEAEPYRDEIETKIISPILKAMQLESCPFTGVLYCGLMITSGGPKVLEFNCRWGDPEAEAVLPLLNTDLVDICQAIDKQELDRLNLNWLDKTAITVVLASKNYPGTPQTGYPITMEKDISSKLCFAGVSQNEEALVNSGGRVIMLTALGDDLMQARERAYRDVEKIRFEGMYFRKDIGLRSNKLY